MRQFYLVFQSTEVIHKRDMQHISGKLIQLAISHRLWGMCMLERVDLESLFRIEREITTLEGFEHQRPSELDALTRSSTWIVFFALLLYQRISDQADVDKRCLTTEENDSR
jgi:hypothetical protein